MYDEIQAVSQYLAEQVDLPYINEQLEPVIIFIIFLAAYVVLLLVFG